MTLRSPSAAAIDPGTIFVLASLFGANRDVIFVDARGTGLSQPRLGCPEFDALAVAAFPNAPPRAAYLASVRQCRDRLRADGVDLDAYDSAANAEDLDDLRVALGYDRWNVLGLSNGGLATLTLMRLHPEGIRSVVLDSPASNDDLWIVDRWRPANRLLEKVFADCAADSACDGQFPGLRYGKTLSTLCSDIIPFETRHDRTEAARAIPEFSTLILDPDAPGADQAAGLHGLGRAACPGGSAPSASPPDPDVLDGNGLDPGGDCRRFSRPPRTATGTMTSTPMDATAHPGARTDTRLVPADRRDPALHRNRRIRARARLGAGLT